MKCKFNISDRVVFQYPGKGELHGIVQEQLSWNVHTDKPIHKYLVITLAGVYTVSEENLRAA